GRGEERVRVQRREHPRLAALRDLVFKELLFDACEGRRGARERHLIGRAETAGGTHCAPSANGGIGWVWRIHAPHAPRRIKGRLNVGLGGASAVQTAPAMWARVLGGCGDIAACRGAMYAKIARLGVDVHVSVSY